MNPTDELCTRIADMLGVEWRKRPLMGFTLTVEAGTYPILEVKYAFPIGTELETTEAVRNTFALVPLEEIIGDDDDEGDESAPEPYELH